MFSSSSLSITGIMFEIMGSFLLAIEAWGLDWIRKHLTIFVKFSTWVRKSFILTLSLSFILFLPFLLGVFNENKFSGLILPSGIFILVFTTLLDDAVNIEKRVSIRINNKSIGPHGFIMLLLGNIIQLISSLVN